MKKCKCIVGMILILCLLCSCNLNDTEENSMETYYKKGLAQLLIEKLDLKEFDYMLEESKMKYIPNDEECKLEAQKVGDLGLKYIYLRNELHLERLEMEDLEKLEKEMRKNGGQLSEEAKTIIEDTFAKVITPKEIVTEEDKYILTFYDNSNEPDFVPMNSLVLKVGTMGEFDTEGNYLDEKHEEEKQKSLQEFVENMELVLEGKLGEIPIRVFVE